ncbi:tetratricopeptide repeat protein [Thiolinea disciformis]|uniref:tetratricopeptide repeat protein n=1 Tax=Thiolinea disciformis TaxID=125614 RepID=UPI0012FF1756|nr:tetratricopeptide repeat protein [Thiolinea disciformis]
MKLIRDIEDATQSDVFLFFADDFVDSVNYTELTIKHLKLQLEMVNQEAEKEQLQPLKPPSPDLENSQYSPLQRLGLAMMYTRSLVPDIGEHKIIWVLYPQSIQNRAAWHDLIASFTPQQGIRDGMQGLRLIFRDLPDPLIQSPSLAQLPRIQFNRFDMSPQAIDNALEKVIYDESLTNKERFDAMLQKAMIDSAHGRFDLAYDYFKRLLGYYQSTNNYALQAVTINAVGDIYARQGEFDKAIHVYEGAIEPAIQSKAAVLLNNVTTNLANAEYNRNNFQLAEQYYAQVEQLSYKMLHLDGALNAIHQQADCALKQLNTTQAISLWEKALEICRRFDFKEELVETLGKLTQAHIPLSQVQRQAYVLELHELGKVH